MVNVPSATVVPVHKTWTIQRETDNNKELTRRERPKSAPYLRLKNIQGTAIGNFWKFFFSKKLFLNFFFEKSIFFRKSHNATKTQKEAIQAH